MSKASIDIQDTKETPEKAGSRELEDWKKIAAEKEKEAAEYFERLKYIQAELENYRKSAAKEKEEIARSAADALMFEFLDVYENLERALENGKKGDRGSLLQAVEMTYGEFKRILEQRGLAPIRAVGGKFDPFKHEALMVEKDEEHEANTVLEEIRRGYMIGDRVLRYSKVKISKR